MIQAILLNAEVAISVDAKWETKNSSTGVRFEVSVYGILRVEKKRRDGMEPGTYLRWGGLLRTDVIPPGVEQVFPETDYRNSFDDVSDMRTVTLAAKPYMKNAS